jgi:hypothetical protein
MKVYTAVNFSRTSAVTQAGCTWGARDIVLYNGGYDVTAC